MNNQEKPLVNVIIPVHNCELYLAEAIQSVLQQSYNPIEVIVVDDGSTDTSAQVAKNFCPAVSVLQKPCGGTGSARNYGIAAAHGEFIAHLDADDIWIEDKIARQIQAFSEQSQLDIVSGHLENFYSPDVANDSQLPHLTEGLIGGHFASATMVRRRVFDVVGLYSTQWKLGSDLDWHLRATEAGLKMKTLDGLVVRRRIHLTNSNIINREFETDRVKILKASLDRRRRTGN